MKNLAPRFGALIACAALAACAHSNAQVASGGSGPQVGTAAGDYLAARHAQSEQDTKLAAALYARALSDDPGSPELMAKTFQLLATSGQFDRAVPIARRIVAQNPGAGLPSLVVIADDVRQHHYDAASSTAATLPDEGLLAIVRPLVVAWIDAGLGNKAAAEAALQPLAAHPGFNLFGDFHKALIDDLLGDQAGARAAFDRAAAANKAQFVRVTVAAGSFYERTGDREAAKKLYEAYGKAHPDTQLMQSALARIAAGTAPPRMIGSAEDGLAESFFDVAGLLHQERMNDIGMILAQLSLHLKPDFAMAKLLIADLYESEHHLASAIATFESIDHAAPVSWSARVRAAILRADSGHVDDAVKRLQEMAEERPQRSDALVALGDVLRGASRFPEAVKAYDRAVARIPDLQQRDWSILYARGIALERSDQWPRAEADFLKALELQPNQPYVLNYLAYSWVEKGIHLKRAQAMLERALQLRPNDPQIVDSMGWALFHLGRYSGAVTHLEKAVELSPEDAVINDHLGDAYWRAGRYNEARYQWNRALRMDPEPELVASLENKIAHGLKPRAAGHSASGNKGASKSSAAVSLPRRGS
ncbi:MAG TPA: tetratricopeptide repeat protein [Alphaproteobacteria bacterium]|nr:tetratricopeptide repeat protein [Alphaproteobacteria bacterium]